MLIHASTLVMGRFVSQILFAIAATRSNFTRPIYEPAAGSDFLLRFSDHTENLVPQVSWSSSGAQGVGEDQGK